MRRNVHRPNQKDNLLDGHEKRRMNAWQLLIGHLEKFLSPSRHESDSVTARGHGRMERAGHGVRRQLSAEKTCGVSARPREAFDPAGSNGVGDQREYDARLDALEDAVDVIRRPSIE